METDEDRDGESGRKRGPMYVYILATSAPQNKNLALIRLSSEVDEVKKLVIEYTPVWYILVGVKANTSR